ncbi:MAG: PQQ-binding-like beta-propeller repeat protein [Acidobacteria bacterium]|nr:PQQ-binding-like beta-propeller repeat protein [Acidobacteriota bacterium]
MAAAGLPQGAQMSLDRRRFLLSLAAAGGVLSSSKPALASRLLPQAQSGSGVQPGDWPVSTYDIRGTRFNQHETIIGRENVERLQVKWISEAAGNANQTTPSVVGDSLYFPAHDGYVYALDSSSGALKWKFNAWEGIQPNAPGTWQREVNADPVGQMRSAVGYANGRLFVGDSTARMHCLEAATGREIWRTQMDPPAGANRSKISSAPIIYDGKVYFGTSTVAGRSQIACLDAGTGAIRWNFHIVPDPKALGGGAVWSASALDVEYGVVYNVTGSVHGRMPGPMLFSESMLANDMESGELLWYDQLRSKDPFDLDYSCHPTLFETSHPTRPGAVRSCVGAGSKTGFHTFDRYSGEHLWTASVTNGGPTLNSTAYGYDKIFMVSNSAASHRLIAQSATVALHAYTGEVLWWTPNESRIGSGVAVANGLFYQGFRDGTLQALDVETGSPLWTYQLPSSRRGGITISNGTLYTTCGEPPYPVYAFSIDGR